MISEQILDCYVAAGEMGGFRHLRVEALPINVRDPGKKSGEKQTRHVRAFRVALSDQNGEANLYINAALSYALTRSNTKSQRRGSGGTRGGPDNHAG